MIVPRFLGGGNKRAHGKDVDQLVVELLAGKSTGCALPIFPADRLGRHTARHGHRLIKHQRFGVDAQIVFRRFADEAFRIYGTRQMGVEIGAFGHVVKEGVKGERPLLASVLQGTSRAGFPILRGGRPLRQDSRHQADQECGNGQTN